jgi:hypothetical protein
MEAMMLRSFLFAMLLALGLGGVVVSGQPAQAAVVSPGAASTLGAVAAPAVEVTPVWHYGRPHYRRGYRDGYRRGYRPRCRWVNRRVWTPYGYRWVQRRICTRRYY